MFKVAWTRFLCPGLLHLDTSACNHPGHKKRVQATVSMTPMTYHPNLVSYRITKGFPQTLG